MTQTLYELAKKSKEDEIALQAIINLYEPKLKRTLTLTEYSERENLSQELKYKLIVGIKKYDIDSTPGFWELRDQISKSNK
jgi:hypothetical protein